MKKIVLILTMFIINSVSFAGNGPFGDEDSKTYSFGFGISTNLFTGSQLFDGFCYNVSSGFDADISTNNIIYMKSQNSFGLFAEFQYNINEWNAFATHIKWNYRVLNYSMVGGNIGESYGRFGDKSYMNNIEIPVMFRHTFHKNEQSLFTGIVGIGIDLSVASQKMCFNTFSQNLFPKLDGGKIELTEKRKINPFVNIGIALDKTLTNNHKLETAVMLNLYPLFNNYKYEYSNPNGYNGGVYNSNSSAFDNHYVSVSVAYYL